MLIARLVLAALALAVFLPLAAGLGATLALGFGHLPAIGATGPSLDPLRESVALPGFWQALALSAFTGVASATLALLFAFAILATAGARAVRLLSPLIAVPHVALAAGLALLIAPSGWFVRLLSPWLTSWTAPPDLALLRDPWGFGLILGLSLKETPFLLFVSLAVLSRLPLSLPATMRAGRALGHSPAAIWLWLVAPMLFPLIRLPFLIVLAYSLSVADMAMILGPSNPPTLAVLTLRLGQSPDLAALLPVAALSLVQTALVLFAILAVLAVERLLARAGPRLLISGQFLRTLSALIPVLGRFALAMTGLTGLLAIFMLALWSLATRWSFPALLPEGLTPRVWVSSGGLWQAAGTTLALALMTSAIAGLMAIAALEAASRLKITLSTPKIALIAALPLILPQMSFLFGLQIAAIRLGLAGGLVAVAISHLIFVFPYVLLLIAGPWNGADRRLFSQAAALGAGPWRRLFRLRLPLLLTPLIAALATGFAVSASLYLPTLILGSGQIVTLTTEAVALSSGSDRRVFAALALLQAALPLAAFALALILPPLIWRRRAGMRIMA